ncbi:MAG TPA: TRAP transporter substrate-binding protein DctP [Dehalococcoidales bacterium]|nr:MAG: hypothetical protein A2Z05_00995 [Chloroflexi bacterium RBG_16_60_22]HJX12172.1 TRAP transporter substrate-binding protein DctP [Dehalococcoidales bacterium]
MKRLALIPLLLILLAGMILASCSQAAPAPAPGQATILNPSTPQGPTTITPQIPAAPAPAPAPAPAKVYKLRYSDWGPSVTGRAKIAQQMARVLEERTGGRVKTDLFFAASLLSSTDTYRGVEAGLADMAVYVLGSFGSKQHQLNRVIDLPGIGMPSMKAGTEIYYKLMAKYPEMDKEYGDAFTLTIHKLPAEHMHTTDKFHLVKSPADMAGVKTYANPMMVDRLASVHAAIVDVGVPQWYSALERNLQQGMLIHWNALYDFGLMELFKYHTVIGDSGVEMQSIGVVMNRNTFNSMPADIQGIVLDFAKDWREADLQDKLNVQQAAINQAKQMGHEIYNATPAEVQQWYDLFKPMQEQWIADTEAAGRSSARAVFNDMLQMIKDYK